MNQNNCLKTSHARPICLIWTISLSLAIILQIILSLLSPSSPLFLIDNNLVNPDLEKMDSPNRSSHQHHLLTDALLAVQQGLFLLVPMYLVLVFAFSNCSGFETTEAQSDLLPSFECSLVESQHIIEPQECPADEIGMPINGSRRKESNTSDSKEKEQSTRHHKYSNERIDTNCDSLSDESFCFHTDTKTSLPQETKKTTALSNVKMFQKV